MPRPPAIRAISNTAFWSMAAKASGAKANAPASSSASCNRGVRVFTAPVARNSLRPFQPQLRRLGAFAGDGEIAPHRIGADHKGAGLTRLARRQHAALHVCLVELRMVGEQE